MVKMAKEVKIKLVDELKEYLQENLEVDEIGNLQTEMLMDFVSAQIGPYYYNQAIADAITYMNEKTEDLYALMKVEGLLE